MRLKQFNRTSVYNNLDKLSDYIVDMPLAHTYRQFNTEHVGMIDRTGSMKHFLDVIPESPVPSKIDGYSLTFSDINLNRAQELIDSGKELYVFWSGGLDSTAILAALSQLVIWPEQVVVCMTHDSLYESGSLYDDVIKKRFDRRILFQTPLRNELNDIDGLILFGAHGGYVCGYLPEHITSSISDINIRDYLSRDYYSFFEPFIENFPKEIKTVGEFYTSYFFNFNWNSNSFLFYTSIDSPDKWISFYGSTEYQNWFISRNGYDPSKECMKEFIRTSFGSKAELYSKHKVTRPSYTKRFDNWLFITEDNQIITLNDIGVKT